MVYRLVGNVCVLMLCGTSTAILRAQDLIYENPVDVDIQGRVVEQGNGLTRTFPDELSLDFNRDGVLDLRFRHELVPNPQQIDTQGIRLLRFAEDGISTSLDVVLGMRRLAITAANEGVPRCKCFGAEFNLKSTTDFAFSIETQRQFLRMAPCSMEAMACKSIRPTITSFPFPRKKLLPPAHTALLCHLPQKERGSSRASSKRWPWLMTKRLH